MNAIKNLWSAFSNLAASINALAAVVDAGAGRLRQQLALDVEESQLLEQRLEESAASIRGKRKTSA